MAQEIRSEVTSATVAEEMAGYPVWYVMEPGKCRARPAWVCSIDPLAQFNANAAMVMEK
jgi:hypothetical protein